MGTSKSYPGPSDRTPLLPDWATPSPDEVADAPEADSGSQSPGAPQTDSGDGQADGGDTSPSSGAGGPIPPVSGGPQHWRAAKTSMGRAAGSGGSGRRNAFKSSANSYVKAHGGSRAAARSAVSGRSATAALGGFLSSVASRGLNATMTAYGLQASIGKTATSVFAAIMNAVAPSGGSREQAVARDAIGKALDDVYEKFVSADGDVSHLDAMTAADVAAAEAAGPVDQVHRGIGLLLRLRHAARERRHIEHAPAGGNRMIVSGLSVR